MIITVIQILITVYTLLLLARVLGSWVPQFSDSRVMKAVGFYTDPYLNLFRKIIPPLGMIDFSPMVAFFALQIFQYILVAIFK